MAPEDLSTMKRPNKTHSIIEYREKLSSFSSEKKPSNDETSSSLNRVRRDRSMIIRAEKLTDKDGKKTNIVSMVSCIKMSTIIKLTVSFVFFRIVKEKPLNASE